MNPLWKLLESDLQTCKDPMTMHKNMAITRSAFIEQYNHYCRNNFKHMHVEDLSPDIYIPVFKKFGIKAVQAKHKWKGNWVETTFLYGLGFNHMYKGIIKRLSATFLKEYNEKAKAEGRPTIDADDEYDQDDDGGGSGDEGGGGAVNSVTGCSGPIIGKIDWNATETKPSFLQEDDEDEPTEWDRMVTRLNEGKAKAATITPKNWLDLIAVSPARFGWTELEAIIDHMDGLPPQSLLEKLYHRMEEADEREGEYSESHDGEDEDEDEDGSASRGSRSSRRSKGRKRKPAQRRKEYSLSSSSSDDDDNDEDDLGLLSKQAGANEKQGGGKDGSGEDEDEDDDKDEDEDSSSSSSSSSEVSSEGLSD